jgi:hypothetical protein
MFEQDCNQALSVANLYYFVRSLIVGVISLYMLNLLCILDHLLVDPGICCMAMVVFYWATIAVHTHMYCRLGVTLRTKVICSGYSEGSLLYCKAEHAWCTWHGSCGGTIYRLVCRRCFVSSYNMLLVYVLFHSDLMRGRFEA